MFFENMETLESNCSIRKHIIFAVRMHAQFDQAHSPVFRFHDAVDVLKL